MKPRILVLGTLDTKGEEFAFLRNELIGLGCDPVVVDLGVMGEPLFEGDVPRTEVLAKAGYTLDELRGGAKRGESIEAVIAGGTAVARELFDAGQIDGVIAMGGGSGTTIGTTIMQAIPFGVPKVVVTTLSRLHPWIKGTDVVVVRTLVDLVGLNPITRSHIAHAAAAIAGMSRHTSRPVNESRSILITCLGVTTPGVMKLRDLLLSAGKEVLVLHRRTHNVPLLIEADAVEAIVDFTPNEIIDAVIHPKDGDPDERLRSAREAQIPIVLSAGALDMYIHFGSTEALPAPLADRKRVVHSRDALLLKTSPEEQALLGSVLGRQLAMSAGPATAVVPMRGFSMWDAEDREFCDPKARESFALALEAEAPAGSVKRVDAHINSDDFAEALCTHVLRVLEQEQTGDSQDVRVS